MGVYINMEMPKSCNACMFDVYGLCLINKNIEDKDELTHSCPLVPVPKHGRLIDENALLKGRGYIIADGMACIPVKYIAAAPTIIPAEEGE